MRFVRIKHAFLSLTLLSLAGCMGGGEPEGRLFRGSAGAIDTASAGFLDELANSEREIATSALARQRGGTSSGRPCIIGGTARSAIRDFCPDDVTVRGPVGDPPGTARCGAASRP